MTSGISTVGTMFGFALEDDVGERPDEFVQLHRINQIGGIAIEPEAIDASALEDEYTKYIIGRTDEGGSLPVSVNLTNMTLAEWRSLIEFFQNREDTDLRMWWEVYHPELDESFYFVANPPVNVPLPEISGNELFVGEFNLAIESFEGVGEPLVPVPQSYQLIDEDDNWLTDENGDSIYVVLEAE